MSTRQEPDTTGNNAATTAAESQNRIDVLASELDAFLKPGGMLLITDRETQDTDFLKSARHLIRLKNIQLTSALVKLQLQELQEKENYLFPKPAPEVENSTLNVTGPFIHPRGEGTTKQTKNTPKSKSVSESKLSTSKQTNSTENTQ